MAIRNSDQDPSETFYSVDRGYTNLSTAQSFAVWIAPFPCTIRAVELHAYGLSGVPQLVFYKSSALSAGTTGIAIGISNAVIQTAGTSGAISFSGLAASGSTLLNMAATDVLCFSTAVANTGLVSLAVNVIVQKTQDTVSYYGFSS